MKRNRNDEPINEVVNRWLKSYNLDKKYNEFKVINGWEELMGKAIASRTKEIFINKKTLYLKLESSVLRNELSHSKEVLINRVNDFAGFEIISNIVLK